MRNPTYPIDCRILTLALLAAMSTVAADAVTADANAAEPRILRKEVVVEASLDEVWAAWTTAEGLKFASPESRVELRVGGPYEWFLQLDPDEKGRRGGEGARILSFLPQQMLAFDWTFPPNIPSLRYSDARTQVVVLFDAVDDEHVRVRFAQHGWQDGADWDTGYAYFDEAWSWVLGQLEAHFAKTVSASKSTEPTEPESGPGTR